jgi:hypothetical protein
VEELIKNNTNPFTKPLDQNLIFSLINKMSKNSKNKILIMIVDLNN